MITASMNVVPEFTLQIGCRGVRPVQPCSIVFRGRDFSLHQHRGNEPERRGSVQVH